ncbi:MAG TPA: CAP domain-containing protein [Candidatus Aminicenantes bacterium]|nr:CAP domain-containing protein [Candidatus Aminicenantes bacterium]HRY64918.1 CAP domain-containing protein [Candidatus Aminicenantes bacterium]HRZ71831.1 CAP domain-containing protein [Candidatus Aminicenantes bacterium]
MTLRTGPWRKRPAILLAAAVGLFVPGVLPAPVLAQDRPAAEAAGPGGPLEAVERALFESINRERAASNLAPLRLSGALTGLARGQSAGMAAAGSLSHDSVTGASLTARLGAAGVFFALEGENVIRSSVADPAPIHAALMKSGGHRENILRPEFDEAGVGLARGLDGTWYVTQDFIRSVRVRDAAEVRALALAALGEARAARGWPPVAVVAEVERTAQAFAALRSEGAELPPVPDAFGPARIHFYAGPDLDALVASACGDISPADAGTGLGVAFARTAGFPGGAYFLCVFYVAGPPGGPRP